MLSKWQIWDFCQSHHEMKLQGLIGIKSFDEYSLRLCREKFFTDKNQKYSYKFGSEVTRDWIEEEFRTLSFFQESNNFIILNPEEISTQVIEDLKGNPINLEGRAMIFVTSSDLTSLKKLMGLDEVDWYIIENPPFWETAKLLDFVLQECQVVLSYGAKKKILSTQNLEFAELFQLAQQIKVLYPELREIQEQEIEETLHYNFVDQFQLASALAQRKFIPFLEKLLSLDIEWERWRSLFFFLQSHFVKIADPSYAQKKKKLSQYDKEIMSAHKIWKPIEIEKLLLRLEFWERLAKSRDSSLMTELRRLKLKEDWSRGHLLEE